MHEVVVPIEYGLLMYQDGYLEARRDQFPHGEKWVSGGCCESDVFTRAKVMRCDQCAQALDEWERTHPAGRGAGAEPPSPAGK
jgi:hypothetical protein